MTRLGIVAAFDREARILAKRERKGPDLRDPVSGEILIALSGIGAAGARAAGEQLLKKGATALLSWGVAAALDRELAAGSLLAPETIIDVDLHRYSADPHWHRNVCERLAIRFVVHTEPLAESLAVLSTPMQKRSVLLHTGAIAADMESAALARLAREAEIPFVAIRAVSDTAATRVPHWLGAAIDSAGRLSTLDVLTQIARRPAEWAAVSRLAAGFWAARATLKGVAREVGFLRAAAA